MKRPIFAYGHPVLRRKCEPISSDDPQLPSLIDDMWETMYRGDGCGLAAPQIGLPVRLFTVDSRSTYENLTPEQREVFFPKGDTGIMETFINGQILQHSDEQWEDTEGCLSIPGLSGNVKRPWEITISYLDRNLTQMQRTFAGTTARIIQHEYDHTEGILYLDLLTPIERKMLTSKLKRIQKGQIQVSYLMQFVK